MIGSKLFSKIMLDQKLTAALLKLNFLQILFWFNAFHDNMNKFINISNIVFDYINKVLKNIFININC
jgi:hypothetical protein